MGHVMDVLALKKTSREPNLIPTTSYNHESFNDHVIHSRVTTCPNVTGGIGEGVANQALLKPRFTQTIV